MRDEIGLILMENEKGEVAVHLYGKRERAQEVFDDMVGNPGDPPVRATLVSVDYHGNTATVAAKDLPNPKRDDSDGWLLGSGPITFEEEESDAASGGD